jgi:hypothetical protein
MRGLEQGGWAALVLCALVFATGCGSKAKQASDPTLARVNDTAITESELKASIERSFGADAQLDDGRRRSVLESLVLSRAIALAREKELDEPGKSALERKVAAYREEVLVRDYLAQHVRPERVTAQQAEVFYREHPERFGAGHVSRYELIATERELAPAERDAVLRALAQAAEHPDWGKWVTELRASRLPLALSTGRGNERALHEQLRRLIAGLSVGQRSSVTFVEGRAYLARVTASEPIAPLPFEQVSSQIKEMLAPEQVKKSLEQARAIVLPKSRVEYVSQK